MTYEEAFVLRLMSSGAFQCRAGSYRIYNKETQLIAYADDIDMYKYVFQIHLYHNYGSQTILTHKPVL
jgi:hypothetical protein